MGSWHPFSPPVQGAADQASDKLQPGRRSGEEVQSLPPLSAPSQKPFRALPALSLILPHRTHTPVKPDTHLGLVWGRR